MADVPSCPELPTCKSKPTIENHKKKVHSSVKLPKANLKKRKVTHFTCEVCQSTFDSKNKLTDHIKEQHNTKEEEIPHSPPRKERKSDNLDNKIEEEDEPDCIADIIDEKEELENAKRKVEELEKTLEKKIQTIQNLNQWITSHIRRTTPITLPSIPRLRR